MTKQNSKIERPLLIRMKNWGIFTLAAVLGLVSVNAIQLLSRKIGFHESPFFVLAELSPLFLIGTMAGFFHPKNAWLWGLATMFLFPILAFIEMAADPYSHNLWPIEFIMYGFMTIPGICGAYVGAFIRRKLIPGHQ
jgi:hypothetical protein